MAAAQDRRLLGVLPPQLQGARGRLSVHTASVVVLNHDGRRYLEACLGSLLDQDLEGGFEVLLVDNASSDGSAEHVRDRFPRVRVLELDRNHGFAGGNNRGLGAAGGRHLVLLNNDTRVRPGWLRALVAALESSDGVGAVQAKLVFADRPNVIQNAGLLLLSDGSGGDRGAGEPDGEAFSRREEVFGACGAAVAYRREALADVGLFDETFFAYYEDLDLSWRMRLRGWRVLFEPAAVVEHVHAGSTQPDSPLMRFHADRNRLFTVLKNAPAGFALSSFGSLGRRAAGHEAAAGGRLPGHRGRVLRSFLAHLPEMLARRARIRARRRVPDAEVLHWLYPRDEWDRRRSESG